MLPESHRSLYLDFQQALVQLKQAQENPEGEIASTQMAFQAVQRSFQQLLHLNWEQLDPSLVGRVQSVQTEINRQFRLLGMDMMYLQASRQSATATQRRQQVSDRIESLIQFCQVLLKSEE